MKIRNLQHLQGTLCHPGFMIDPRKVRLLVQSHTASQSRAREGIQGLSMPSTMNKLLVTWKGVSHSQTPHILKSRIVT
jgi:hypothetical protein